MLDDELAVAQAPATQPAASDEDAKARKQQYELAKMVLAQVMQTFNETSTALQGKKAQEVKPKVTQGAEQLESLRRLFFSIVEHLKETAQRQAQLNDDTRDVATLADSPTEPLATRQQELMSISRQIADSLTAQSQQPPPAGTPPRPSPTASAPADPAEQLAQAAKAVEEAAGAMENAGGKLAADPADLKGAAEPQQTALTRLIEAIALLEPPQQEQEQQQQQPGEQNQPEQEDQPEKGEDQKQQQQQMDVRHLLQSVRDRAAQRERERRQKAAGYQAVEKDW
jgi:hypothetical protein